MTEDAGNSDWKVYHTESGPDLYLFRTRFDWVENPRNGRRMKAVVLEAPDWVDIIAVTPQGSIVVVSQHRLGVGRTTVEIPAGIVEPGETPEQAAKRELGEETGYTATSWEYLGWVETNTAFMNNRCHTWLARGAVHTGEPHLDAGEDIEIMELTFEEVCQEIRKGRMRNVFVLAALARVYDLRGKLD